MSTYDYLRIQDAEFPFVEDGEEERLTEIEARRESEIERRIDEWLLKNEG